MTTSLRKGISGIHITYKNGGYTNSLSGSNYVVHESPEKLDFEIDVSINYKVQNKETNSYLDIHEFSESAENLKFLQIDDEQVLKGLGKAKQRNPNAIWYLTLNAGKLGIFKYSVKPEKYASIGYQFNVIGV